MLNLKFSKLRFLPLFFLVLFVSCEDSTDIAIDDSDVEVRDGRLIFKDSDHFYETLDHVKSLDANERTAWERRLNGFSSKRSLIDEAHIKLASATEENYHSIRKELTDQLRFDEDGNFLGFVFPMRQTASLLNTDGIVQIGDDIRVYKNDRLIILVGGDLTKLSDAERLTTSNEDEGIIVNPIKTRRIAETNGRTEGQTNVCYTQATSGLPRYLRVAVDFSTVVVNSGSPYLSARDYEVDFLTFVIQYIGTQIPLYSNINVSVSANLSWYDSWLNQMLINDNYGPRVFSNYNWSTSTNMFADRITYSNNAGTFRPQLRLTYTVSAAGLTCSSTNQLIILLPTY